MGSACRRWIVVGNKREIGSKLTCALGKRKGAKAELHFAGGHRIRKQQKRPQEVKPMENL